MNLKRRNFIQLSTLAAGSAMAIGFQTIHSAEENALDKKGIEILSSKSGEIVPISVNERKERIAKAQRLLLQNKMQAIVLESGTALEYFTGISWWPSERTMVAVIPATGEIKYVCPAFEEPRFRELITIGNKVYIWQEDESPYRQVARAFSDSGINTGKIGIEEELRFFIFDGVRKESPRLEYVSADPVTIPCRMIKSAAELALMQQASDITVAAMKTAIGQLKEGVSPSDISEIVNNVHSQMGATPDFALILFGESSALPHGSIKPQQLKKGDIVLMDCGCKVNGYCSDITRTIVFGAEPTKRQLEIWNLEQKAQAAGFAAARIGNKCEMVDAAARKVITDAGFGPGYQLPGLPHRTGHGIGLDGHEWGNMVKGNQLPIEAGMCFSIEPTISIPGEFGVRMEDCVYMTTEGARWFSQPAVAIDKPFV
ncbi:MAG TPA: Xaa-Pro peptidase family protein [Puia sp.]|nr:Xaa-Pro peptidase family protein [Puia sp.]